jgi:SNF2 family DNA or RNA helicase
MNRTHVVYGERGDTTGIQAGAERVLLLTGTPTPNHAGELFQHCRTLWPQVLRKPMDTGGALWTEAEFQERFTRYKDTPWGRQVVGSSNTHLLRERLRPFVLHRAKATVLPELPPLVVQDIALNRSARTVASQLSPGLNACARELDRLDDQALFRAIRTVPTDEETQPLASLRRQLGELKIDPTVEWIVERLECGVRKILVFAWHVHVISHLARRLAEFDPAVITGATGPHARESAIYRFQNHAPTRVFIGQILAAGTAITLTAASEVAIVEPSWVPGDNTQAIGRAHRLGQHDSVLASFLYLPGTLDQRIMSIMRRKAAETSDLIGEDNCDVERAGAADHQGLANRELRLAGHPVGHAADHPRHTG